MAAKKLKLNKKDPESWFSHQELCELTAKWVVRNMNMKQAYIEHKTMSSREIVDVLGFRSDGQNVLSVNYEIKVTRSDFLSDKNKPHRNGEKLGIGAYRFYVCPRDVIKPSDLPKGWGLIHVSKGGRFNVVVGPKDWKCLYHPSVTYLRGRFDDMVATASPKHKKLKRIQVKHLSREMLDLKFYWTHQQRDCGMEGALLFAALNQYCIASERGLDIKASRVFDSPLRNKYKEERPNWQAEEKEWRE